MDVSLPPFLPPFPCLKINKQSFKKKKESDETLLFSFTWPLEHPQLHGCRAPCLTQGSPLCPRLPVGLSLRASELAAKQGPGLSLHPPPLPPQAWDTVLANSPQARVVASR